MRAEGPAGDGKGVACDECLGGDGIHQALSRGPSLHVQLGCIVEVASEAAEGGVERIELDGLF